MAVSLRGHPKISVLIVFKIVYEQGYSVILYIVYGAGESAQSTDARIVIQVYISASPPSRSYASSARGHVSRQEIPWHRGRYIQLKCYLLKIVLTSC